MQQQQQRFLLPGLSTAAGPTADLEASSSKRQRDDGNAEKSVQRTGRKIKSGVAHMRMRIGGRAFRKNKKLAKG
jgi:hypothetical protein